MKTWRRLMTVIAIVAVFSVTALVHAGELDQTETPAPTMRTLDEIYSGVDNIPPVWSRKLPASERFVEVFGGDAVLDKETGLVWARDANMWGELDLGTAMLEAMTLTIDDRRGWRLPSFEEMSSLLDMSLSGTIKVTPGVFTNIQQSEYWTTTMEVHVPNTYWTIYMTSGGKNGQPPSNTNYVWPVRGPE